MPLVTRELPFIEYLDNPKLKPFTRRLAPGEYLFRQGDIGTTLFIVTDGIIWLVAERDGEQHVVSVLERGQFLGEKAVMSPPPYKRFFSAKAHTHTRVLELGVKQLDLIHVTMPEILIDMFRRMFFTAADRLESSNHLARLLRSSDNVERLVHLILYFAQTSGRKVQDGTEFLLSLDSIHYYIDMKKQDIQTCLDGILKGKLLRKVLNEHYFLPDEKLLVEAIPVLRQRLLSSSVASTLSLRTSYASFRRKFLSTLKKSHRVEK